MNAPANPGQLAKLKRLAELRKNYKLFFYRPYPKQELFHNLGATKRERLLRAGNQLGKTLAAGYEVAYHTTGLYPDWWRGYRCRKENRGWAGGLTSEMTRDGMQRILLGPIGQWGTGAIPKELIVDIKRARGVPDAVETVLVRHANGEVSQITFKAYADGREAWQSETLDWLWFDEEPPRDIYMEGLTRTNTTGGPVFLTFTPLMGMTQTVMRFLSEEHADRADINMTIDDVGHYTAEQKAKIIASYLPHEREARVKGTPMLGSGRIFPVAEEIITEAPIVQIPSNWRHIIGMDFGYEHPTAAVHILFDEDADVYHVHRCHRLKEATPLIHSAAIRPWGEWIPVAWPHDGYQHDKGGSCEQLSEQYRNLGLSMLTEHATFGDKRGNGVEAGLMDMLERMQTGRFKVNVNCADWFEEFRIYHREDGKVVKLYDDLLCATRYACMMMRFSTPGIAAPGPRDKYARSFGGGDDGTTWMSA